MGNACDSKPSTTSTEKVQLVYWNLHGRSDFCQAMLYAGGVPYDLDEETANVWPEGRDATPFGQIPVLKHGSLTLAQGGALTRYCARLGGLYPEDMTEASICDMYLEEVMDIYGALFKAKNASNKDAKLVAWKMLETEHLPKHYSLLEKNLVNSGKPFLGGDRANASDIAFFACNNVYLKAGLDVDSILSENPKLKAALEGAKKVGDLKNFPDRGLYFSSDPDHACF